MRTIFNNFFEFFVILLQFYILIFWSWGMWISAPWPGIKPSPPALESEVLTTGPPGKSPVWLTIGYQMMCVCVSCSVVSDSVICDSMDCSPPGSSLHGILQARILEWVAISFSRIAKDISNELWNLYLESITNLKVSVNTDNFGLNLVGVNSGKTQHTWYIYQVSQSALSYPHLSWNTQESSWGFDHFINLFPWTFSPPSAPEYSLSWLPLSFVSASTLKLILMSFNWRIIVLQSFAVFCQTSAVSHKYIYISSLLNLPPISLPIPLF